MLKYILQKKRFLLTLSFLILFIQLVLVINFSIQLFESKKETDKQVTFLNDQFLEKSFAINKMLHSIYQIANYKLETHNIQEAKNDIDERSRFFLGHSINVLWSQNKSIEILLKNNDPLFLEEQYVALSAEFKNRLKEFRKIINQIKKDQTSNELLISMAALKKTANDLGYLVNQYDNIFSNLTGYYLSFNRKLAKKSSQQIDRYLTLLIILSFLSIVLIIFFVMTKRVADFDLKSNEKLLRRIASNYPALLRIIDKNLEINFSSGKEFRKSNPNSQSYLHLPLEKFFSEHTPIVKNHFQKAFQGTESTFELTIDGQHQLHNICPLPDEKGKINQILSVVENITERKQAEEKIKASLKEKEILLQEIHHRVKNNMSVISGLLDLQMNNTDNKIAKEALQDSQNRVQSMSMIHETLYRSDNLADIDLARYLSDLGKVVLQNYAISKTVHFKVKAESVMIDSKLASTVGLIVNELIANSLKYAFTDDREGEILLELKSNKENGVELMVSDNGVGIPKGFDLKTADSLGLKLVKMLVENQLDGSIKMESNNGTKFTIKFNIEG